MSVVHEGISRDTVSVWLTQEIQVVRRHLETARHKAARTLIKTPQLSVVLVAVREGGELSEHTAEGPITIHVLDGCIDFYVLGRRQTLRSEEHTSELQSQSNLVCRLLLEK